VDTYLVPVVIVIVLISAMPIFIEIWRARRERRRAALRTGSGTE
jgi:membrane-associated protein